MGINNEQVKQSDLFCNLYMIYLFVERLEYNTILKCASCLGVYFVMHPQDNIKVLPLVKQEKVEKDDCNLDLKVEVNIRAECGLSTGKCN